MTDIHIFFLIVICLEMHDLCEVLPQLSYLILRKVTKTNLTWQKLNSLINTQSCTYVQLNIIELNIYPIENQKSHYSYIISVLHYIIGLLSNQVHDQSTQLIYFLITLDEQMTN